MKSNVIAAMVLTVMCSGVNASEKALEALHRTAGDEVVKNTSIQEPAAQSDRLDGSRGGTWVYANSAGCVVTAEQRNNGMIVYVQDGRGQQATLGFLSDMRSGDIFSYCSPARTELKGQTLLLSCAEQNNGGYSTRGSAAIEMNGGVSRVSVTGEVKRALGWKTDTQISCDGLKPDLAKSAGSAKGASLISGTYRFSDGYTDSKLTVREVRKDGARKLEFSISAGTAGGHTGEIEGTATPGQNGSFSFRGTGGCALTLKPGTGKLTVSGANDSCGDYLGMNVYVDGEYLLD
ncbi:MAG: hypothetical protein NDI60_11475 [Elusimicrobiales bacterium]|nr:hypothetical protein [Elusimicrobiales bacterium]